MIVAALLSLIVGVWKEPFLRLLKSTENLDAYAATYLEWVVVFGAVPAVFNMVVANVIRGEGYSLHAGLGLSLGGVRAPLCNVTEKEMAHVEKCCYMINAAITRYV